MTTRRILIDTDPGIDDSLAILLALASPEITIEGLTVVHGNCSKEQGTRNALAILKMARTGHIPVAEFNVSVYPHAADVVYHSGVPITLVPLDATYLCVLTHADMDSLAVIPSPISRFIIEATRFYMEFHDTYQKIDGCVINDPLALALTFAPELCDYEEHYVDVDIQGGVSMGKTFAYFYQMTGKPANMKVALGVPARIHGFIS